MQTPEISIKRGDTLQLGCTYADRDGAAQSLAGHDVRSQIRDASSTLLATLAVNLADQTLNPGEFAMFASASDTALWPVGRYAMDIQITHGAVVISSETVTFKVLQDITHD